MWIVTTHDGEYLAESTSLAEAFALASLHNGVVLNEMTGAVCEPPPSPVAHSGGEECEL